MRVLHLLAPVLAGVLTALVSADPAAAHGGATITIFSDGYGSVWLTGTWQDGHPVVEPVRATLSADGPSGTIGPVPLTPVGDELGTHVYSGTLPVGPWHILITADQPVGGRCQATVPVGAPGTAPLPLEVACLVAASPSSSPSPSPKVPRWLIGVLVAGVVVSFGIVLVPVVRRARRPR